MTNLSLSLSLSEQWIAIKWLCLWQHARPEKCKQQMTYLFLFSTGQLSCKERSPTHSCFHALHATHITVRSWQLSHNKNGKIYFPEAKQEHRTFKNWTTKACLGKLYPPKYDGNHEKTYPKQWISHSETTVESYLKTERRQKVPACSLSTHSEWPHAQTAYTLEKNKQGWARRGRSNFSTSLHSTVRDTHISIARYRHYKIHCQTRGLNPGIAAQHSPVP